VERTRTWSAAAASTFPLEARQALEGTVLHCLGHVPGPDARLAGEVGDGARDP
jgi:hypothetical protein